MTKDSIRCRLFIEPTRVPIPALVHLTRSGYQYFGKTTEDMAGTVYDQDIIIQFLQYK